MTEKQKRLVEWIEDMTGVRFTGGNLSEYINEWRPKAEHEAYMLQLAHEAEMDMIDARRDW